MPSGGYKVYDCKNVSAVYPNSVKMPGLYNFIESSNGKPILLKNIKPTDSYISAAYVAFRDVSGMYVSILTVNANGNDVLKIGVTQEDDFYITTLKSTLPPAVSGNQVMSEDEPSASM